MQRYKKAAPLLVIVGIVLSVLHQSSLGSLFVMFPYSMNPLWYTPWLGAFFITSAIFCGYSMVIVCELLMARFDNRPPKMELLAQLSEFSIVFLSLYLGFKIMDISSRKPALSTFALFDKFTLLYVAEMGLGVLLPLVLLSLKKLRNSAFGVGCSSTLILLFGGGLNRLNVSVFSMDHNPLGYQPTFVEYMFIPVMLILVLGFFVAITRLFPICYKYRYTIEPERLQMIGFSQIHPPPRSNLNFEHPQS